MANVFFTKAKRDLLKSGAGSIDLEGDTLKVMLVDSTYAPNPDDEFVDDGTANDPLSHEISVTGYTGGFGGGGRKTITGSAVTADLTDDEAVWDANDITWTALGSGATIGGCVIIKEITDDTLSRVIAFLDTTNIATNGSNINLSWNSEGIFNW